MQEQGKLRFLGLTETFAEDDHHQTLSAGLADDLWDAMMVGYNLLTPMPEEEVLPEARAADVGISVAAPCAGPSPAPSSCARWWPG